MYSLVRRTLKILISARSISDINLIGRDYIVPNSLSPEEIKSLLWTSINLKCLSKQNNFPDDLVSEARITLLLDKFCLKSQMPLKSAVDNLGASMHIILDSDWKNCGRTDDYGRMLATHSDIIFCNVEEQSKVGQIADGAHVPVILIKSFKFDIVKTLADLMSLQLYFSFLKGLTVAWVGLPGPTINTYLCMMPRLGLNIKYCCACKPLSPLLLQTGLKNCQRFSTEMHECNSVSQTIYRADVISTCGHDQPKFCVTMKDVKEAAIKWAFLHDLPRCKSDVEDKVFRHENSLVWESLENYKWIYTAIILRMLSGFTHTIPEPNFNKNM